MILDYEKNHLCSNSDGEIDCGRDLANSNNTSTRMWPGIGAISHSLRC